jgi:anti-sigma B factor antagonist
MEFTVQELGQGTAVVRGAGRLNMVSAGQLRELVASTVAGGNPRIVVDLSAVDFIDSSGLGALVNGLKTARQAGGDLRISAPNDQVKLVLQLTNMERVLSSYPTAESAYAND